MKSAIFLAGAAAAALAASADRAAAQVVLPEIVTTAGRSEQKIQEVGSAITVVQRSEIARTNPGSLVDALRAVPGLDISENGGPGATASVRIRGANPGQTLVLIDGVRANDPSAASGDFEFALLDPGVIERIEVLRGPQTALYGSDAIGGVINIITRSGGGKPTFDISSQGGRYGTQAHSGSTTGSNGPWSYAFSATAQHSDGFSRFGYRVPSIEARYPNGLERDPFSRVGGFGKIGYDAGNGIKLEVAGLKSYTHSAYDSATGAFPDTNSIAKRIIEQYWARGMFDSFGGVLTNTLSVYTNRTERNFTDVSLTATKVTSADTDSVGIRNGAEYQGNIKLGKAGSVIVGSRYERETMSIYTSQVSPTVVPRALLLAPAQETRSIFGLWNLPLGERLTVSLGGRIDDVQGVDRFETWRATAAYWIPETGTKLRTSAGTGGKAPTLYQLYHPTFGNSGLQSEHSTGWDAGIDQSLFNDRAKFSVTGFSNSFTNLIDFVSVPAPGKYQNVSKAATSGVEFEGTAEIVPHWVQLKAAYTYLRAVDSTTGLTLSRRPRNSGRIAVAITPNDRWLIEPRLFFVSKRFSSSGELNPVSSYARLDLYTEYRVDQNWRVFARVENALNTYYQEVTGYGTTGQALYAGVAGSW